MSRAEHSEKNQDIYTTSATGHAAALSTTDSTLYLAYRDLSETLKKYLTNPDKKYRFLDYGCGTGFSTRNIINALKKMKLDVEAFGLDINLENLKQAAASAENTDIRFLHFSMPNKLDTTDSVEEQKPYVAELELESDSSAGSKPKDGSSGEDKFKGNLEELSKKVGGFDLVTCSLVLCENNHAGISEILSNIQEILAEDGVVVIINPSKSVYKPGPWYSLFTAYKENNPVFYNEKDPEPADEQTVMISVIDPHTRAIKYGPFTDFYHPYNCYHDLFTKAGFIAGDPYEPLGKGSDGIAWEAEKTASPYAIFTLTRSKAPSVDDTPSASALPRP